MNLFRLTVRLVPYEDFYNDDAGENLARFCFAKDDPVLDEACMPNMLKSALEYN